MGSNTAYFTMEQVASHNREDDCWIVIGNQVFDVTNFLSVHPGGKKVILNKAGQDATKEFQMFHSPDVLKKYGPQLYVGELGTPQSAKTPSDEEDNGDDTSFGSIVPYGEPTWYQSWKSPYFNDTHRRVRDAVRNFVDQEIMPYCHEWDEQKQIPKQLFERAGKIGILAGIVSPPWPVEYFGTQTIGGIKPEEWGVLHSIILADELSRCGSGGVLWGLFGGLGIGLPPVLRYGSQYLQDKVVRDCLTGKKNICLAITEPAAGSDVANITTRAEKSEDGKFYIVNGEKKFITNGIFADYFTVAVRTGPPDSGMAGISFLLLERTMPGLKTRRMEMQGVWASGTTYITFEDVHVPVENLIGEENNGFRYIMLNFNTERLGIVVQCNRLARICYEEAFKYAHKRKTFGKRLVDHPVIRLKLANMARQIESTHAWLESIAYQLSVMTEYESLSRLAGPISLLKAHSTGVLEYCVREAAQVFGGLAYTRGGQAEKVERIYRDTKAYTFGGGSEEIMLDLGARVASKDFQSKL